MVTVVVVELLLFENPLLVLVVLVVLVVLCCWHCHCHWWCWCWNCCWKLVLFPVVTTRHTICIDIDHPNNYPAWQHASIASALRKRVLHYPVTSFQPFEWQVACGHTDRDCQLVDTIEFCVIKKRNHALKGHWHLLSFRLLECQQMSLVPDCKIMSGSTSQIEIVS